MAQGTRSANFHAAIQQKYNIITINIVTRQPNTKQKNRSTVHYFGFWQEDKGPSFC